MKEEKFKLNTCIGGWYINPKICDGIIKYFEKSNRKLPGHIYGDNAESIVDKEFKTSTDISLRGDDSLFDSYNHQLNLCVQKYSEKYEETKILMSPYSSAIESYNIQKYRPKEGFYKWHFERGGFSSRCLVFMTYLNDVKNGGTEFKYQKLTTPAKKGLTLIWPTDFTHTHRGQISKETKYIVTGWFNFIK